MLTTAAASDPGELTYDLSDDNVVSNMDAEVWIKELRNTWCGDANVDGQFNSQDFVDVFVAGKYEQDVFAVWTEGDWDVNGRFTSSDFVTAFQDGGYEQGPRTDVAAVPEPGGVVLSVIGFVVWLCGFRIHRAVS